MDDVTITEFKSGTISKYRLPTITIHTMSCSTQRFRPNIHSTRLAAELQQPAVRIIMEQIFDV